MKTSISEILRNLVAGKDPVAALENAIDALQNQRDDADLELRQFVTRRRELLLAGDGAALSKLRTSKDEAEDRRDAANLALDHIRQRLQAAKDEAHVKGWIAGRAEAEPFVAELIASAAVTREKFDSFIAWRVSMGRKGFEREVAQLPVFPNVAGSPIVAPELIEKFLQDWKPDVGRRTSAARLGTVAPAPAPRPSANGKRRFGDCHLPPAVAPRVVRGDEGSARHESATALPHDTSPIGEDEVRARVVRSGFPDINGVASARGRIIRTKKATADKAQENGAIEITQVGPAEALRPMTQIDSPSTDIRVST